MYWNSQNNKQPISVVDTWVWHRWLVIPLKGLKKYLSFSVSCDKHFQTQMWCSMQSLSAFANICVYIYTWYESSKKSPRVSWISECPSALPAFTCPSNLSAREPKCPSKVWVPQVLECPSALSIQVPFKWPLSAL